MSKVLVWDVVEDEAMAELAVFGRELVHEKEMTHGVGL
jgi:hypothetical protein